MAMSYGSLAMMAGISYGSSSSIQGVRSFSVGMEKMIIDIDGIVAVE
jgi:hypothetical protein